jgi:hypothetical protein
MGRYLWSGIPTSTSPKGSGVLTARDRDLHRSARNPPDVDLYRSSKMQGSMGKLNAPAAVPVRTLTFLSRDTLAIIHIIEFEKLVNGVHKVSESHGPHNNLRFNLHSFHLHLLLSASSPLSSAVFG